MAVTPETFVPQFDSEVKVYAPNGSSFRVNPKYCATKETADAVRDILSAKGFPSTMFQQGPQGRLFSGWASDPVYWLQFQEFGSENGTKINAGLLADYFTHGYPVAYALAGMVREYEWEAYNQGFGPSPSPWIYG